MAPKASTSSADPSASTSRKAAGSSKPKTNGRPDAVASTSKVKMGSSSGTLSSNAKGKGPAGAASGRMTPFESMLHDYALKQPKRTIMQASIGDIPGIGDDKQAILASINALIRKNLFKVAKNARGEAGFVAVSKLEAKELGAMDPDDKLVLDHIAQTTNQGIWIRTLKAKTGLHQTVINKSIKALEQKKMIKNVKSVKFPTRKIYMLENMVPSIDVTGGPWYNGNELDMEFINLLTQVAKKYIRDKSLPGGMPELSYPLAFVPYLPTANDVLEYMIEKKVLSTDLNVEHIEMVLNVLVWDGEIERIWARRYEEDGKHTEFQIDVASPVANGKSKKRKKAESASNGRKKKRRRGGTADSDDIDADSGNDDSDASTDSEVLRNQMSEDEDYSLPPALSGKGMNNGGYSDGDDDEDDEEAQLRKRHKRPGPAGNEWYWVYRTCLTSIGTTTSIKKEDGTSTTTTTYPQIYETGLSQTPCGICPVSDFCYNRGQPQVIPLPGEKDLLKASEGTTGWEDWRNSVTTSSKVKAVATESATDGKRIKGKEGLKELALLKMKVPAGSGEMEDADGNWKGGGKVGGQVIAPVNPANCRYYSQWFGEDIEW